MQSKSLNLALYFLIRHYRTISINKINKFKGRLVIRLQNYKKQVLLKPTANLNASIKCPKFTESTNSGMVAQW